MATQQFYGDETSAVAQLATNTVANTWAASDTLTTTLTLEDGVTTQAVVSTATSSTIETGVRDVHLADLQASTLSEFLKITWAASSTDAITATAKTAGVPFYLAATESTAGSGTFTEVETTANAGPNDWNTAANWTSAVPVGGDTVYFNRGSSSILYGLNQSSVSLAKFVSTDQYTGSIGDLNAGYYLQIDVNSTTGTPDGDSLTIGSGGLTTMIDGDSDIVIIRAKTGGLDMVKLKGNSKVDGSMRITDGCSGTVNIAANYGLNRLTVSDSPRARVLIGSHATSFVFQSAASGVVEITDRSMTGLDVSGGTVTLKGTSAVSGTGSIGQGQGTHIHGGNLNIQTTQGTFGRVEMTGGNVSLTSQAQALTISKAYIYGGTYNDTSQLGNVGYSDGIRKFGGTVNVPNATITQI